MQCNLNAKGEIVHIYSFHGDSDRLDKICNNNYLFMKIYDVELPYKIGDILKIDCMPYKKEPAYVVYGGNLEKDNEQNRLQHYCICISENTSGNEKLYLKSLSALYSFDKYSPVLTRLELVETSPKEPLNKHSRLLKDNPDIWWEIAKEHKEYMDRKDYLNKHIEKKEVKNGE